MFRFTLAADRRCLNRLKCQKFYLTWAVSRTVISRIRLHKMVRSYLITCKILYRAIRSVTQSYSCTIAVDCIAPSHRFCYGTVSIYSTVSRYTRCHEKVQACPAYWKALHHKIRHVTSPRRFALYCHKQCWLT